MGKYEDAKHLVKKTARKNYVCINCSKEIIKSEEYYRETFGLVNPGPNVTLNAYHIVCGKKSGMPINDK